MLFSVAANATHGNLRTNEDKRRAVLTLLNDPEWGAWSDNEIARRCGVSQPFVSKLRPPQADTNNGYKYEARTFIHPKTGEPTVMRTANIGATPRPAFTCECGEQFPEQVWHCAGCDHHWPMHREDCANCYKPAPHRQPDPPRFDHDAAAVREQAMTAIAYRSPPFGIGTRRLFLADP